MVTFVPPVRIQALRGSYRRPSGCSGRRIDDRRLTATGIGHGAATPFAVSGGARDQPSAPRWSLPGTGVTNGPNRQAGDGERGAGVEDTGIPPQLSARPDATAGAT